MACARNTDCRTRRMVGYPAPGRRTRGPRTARRACRRQPAPALGSIPSVVSPSSNLHSGGAINPTNRRASGTDHCSRSTTVGVGETCAVAANMYIARARGMESIHNVVGCEFRGSDARKSQWIFRSSACRHASEPLQRMPVVNFDHPTLHGDSRLAERRKGA